ncbi:MAG: carboxypeptidase regulatory-like domain-containing protein, partial [Acidobacteriota bacterium]|nr:carboxypeptidase regulatory-like domain-containing protein [Acidobacteriota bacterium]
MTGLPVTSAVVSCNSQSTKFAAPGHVDAHGNYAIASLSPGTYTITISAPRYQTQQARTLELPVAGRVELNFTVRPLSDVWEAGQFRSWILPQSQQALGFYGPDVDTSRVAVFNANRGVVTPLDNSRSDVVAQPDIQNLPLVGRDVYTMLLLLPGVTSDTATGRGLGFSVNGQRPSSSNYLLDGVENNNLLVTGPLSAAVPEFIQEYRVSTTNYSAEYGRTSGFVANAITRSGTNQWHGSGFFYFENDRLNANGFQENAQGIRRAPFTEIQPGLTVAGPLIRNRLFLFAGFQTVRSHGRSSPQPFALPTTSFIKSTDPASYAGQLLRRYKPESAPSGPGDSAVVAIAPVTSFNRTDGLVRADYSFSASHQLFARAAWDGIVEPELLFNPYRDFSTPYRQTSLSIGFGLISRFGAASQNEFRAARTGDSVRLQTPHAEVPSLIDDERIGPSGQSYEVVLPGNASQSDYRNRGRNWELLDNWTLITGRHALKFGAGFLQRTIDLNLSVYPRGYLEFANVNDFAQNKLGYLTAQYDRFSPTHDPVSPDRLYRYRQSYAFAQDSFHLSNRLTVDYGVRYEFFGSPVNTGGNKDFLLQIPPTQDIRMSIRDITPVQPAGTAGQLVYTSRPSNWAVRAGLAWDPIGNGRTLIRASYGIFYDRPFDNLWQNVIQNRYKTAVWKYEQPTALNVPLSRLETAGQEQSSSELIPGLAFQPNLRAPRTQSAFVGIQERVSRDITLEVDALASRARQLITTDEVNRPFSDTASSENPFGYSYPNFANYINYRANQGSSNYSALVTAVKLRKTRFNGQVSYSWSHSIDNQSESLAGTFFDFNTFGLAPTAGNQFISSFTRQFASGLDRGNSDFDQRHNVVFFGRYQTSSEKRLPKAFRSWTVAALGAVRSGLPFTVYANANYTVSPIEIFVNQRANVASPKDVYTSQPRPGGRLLLNPEAFSSPGANVVGNGGRNAFAGPGLFNMDASIARTFAPPVKRESMRLTARADFYNLLNHANLNNPASFYGNADFGVALYGRREMNNGFPLLAPLNETARQIQILLRLEF